MKNIRLILSLILVCCSYTLFGVTDGGRILGGKYVVVYNNNRIYIPNECEATGNTSYVWERKSNTPGAEWVEIPGATNHSIDVQVSTTYPVNSYYRRKAVKGNEYKYSNKILVLNVTPSVELRCEGDTISFALDKYNDVYAVGIREFRTTDPDESSYEIDLRHNNYPLCHIYFMPNEKAQPTSAEMFFIFDIGYRGSRGEYLTANEDFRLLYRKYAYSENLIKDHTDITFNNIEQEVFNGSTYDKSVTYYDGLGRPIQMVDVGGPSDEQSLVSFLTYDNMGRSDATSYMPYVVNDISGNKRSNPTDEQQLYYRQAFPNDEDNPYAFSQTIYDNSGLNLANKKSSPGKNYSMNAGHPVEFGYRLNYSNEVKRYRMVNDTCLQLTGYYSNGTLNVTEIKSQINDAYVNSSYEYTDSKGQLIAKSVKTNGESRFTYYVYDDLGAVRYIIPPILDDILMPGITYSPMTTELHDYAYYSEYDRHGRVTRSLNPGVDWSYFIYDQKDRLVMSQDGNQRTKSPAEWSYYVYDNLDRMAEQSIIAGNMSREAIQTRYDARGFDNSYPYLGGTYNILKPFSDNSFAVVSHLQSNQYDTYYEHYESNQPDVWEPYIEGRYFVISRGATMGSGADGLVDICDPEGRYFTSKRDVKSEYHIYTQDPNSSDAFLYYYIPVDCYDIVENIITMHSAYYTTSVFKGTGTPLKGKTKDLRPFYPYVKNRYFVISRGAATNPAIKDYYKECDPEGRYFSSVNSVNAKYHIYTSNPNSSSAMLYYYIPADCMNIVEKAIEVAAYSTTTTFMGTGTPTTGVYGDIPPTVPFVKGLYFTLSRNGVNHPDTGDIYKEIDPEGKYISDKYNIRSIYKFGQNSTGSAIYCYIPEDCMDIVNNLTNYPGYSTTTTFSGDGKPLIGLYYAEDIKPGPELLPDYLGFMAESGFDKSFNIKPSGLTTYEKSAILNGVDADCEFVERAFYYDKKGRLIQTVEKNQLGGISRYSMKYDFAGNLIEGHEAHSTGDYKHTTQSYDKRSRLLSTTTIVNDSEPVTTTYAYNELGQLASLELGSSGITETYTYTLPGALKEQDSDLFNMKFFSDKGPNPDYTGKITAIEWDNKLEAPGTWFSEEYGNCSQMYVLDYDTWGQLSGSSHIAGNGNEAYYFEDDMMYDKNGNITTMSRYSGESSPDMLDYHYSGNKLMRLGTDSETFSYDANGNMIVDGRTSWNYHYNYLNLLSSVADDEGNELAGYTYLVGGKKCAVRDADGNGFVYLGSLQYVLEEGEMRLESTPFDCGRITAIETTEGTSYDPVYFITDYLGSVRAVVNGTNVSYNNYYPYGGRWEGGSASSNRYLYNGKELQTTGSLGHLLDYGSRMYDPMLGRWFSTDPAAQFASPYAFCGNNPIMMLDPDGELAGWAIGLIVYFGTKFIAAGVKAAVNKESHFARFGKDIANTGKILWGGVKGSFGQVASRWSWELPQAILGIGFSEIMNIFGTVDKVDYWGGATTVKTKGGWGGVTLGSYIVGDKRLKADPENSLFQHEYGHYKQSQVSGLFYLGRFGLPSLFHPSKGHKEFYTEQDANARALRHFQKYVSDDFASSGKWVFSHPIDGYNPNESYDSAGNKQALSNAKVNGVKWYDPLLFFCVPGLGIPLAGITNYFTNK